MAKERDMSSKEQLHFYGKNSCKTILGFGGNNHYYLTAVKKKPRGVFELRRSSNYELISTFNADFKLSPCERGNCNLEYVDEKTGKRCNIKMMPCNPSSQKDYPCPIPGVHFTDDNIHWYTEVSNWFVRQGAKIRSISSAPNPLIATASEEKQAEIADALLDGAAANMGPIGETPEEREAKAKAESG
jgi:hypothetical protein